MKGKEYFDNGKLKFEGEYIFDQKLCGKGYDLKGNILYELEKGKGFINDNEKNKIIVFSGENLTEKKLEGIIKGKEYDYNGNLLFEGEYSN